MKFALPLLLASTLAATASHAQQADVSALADLTPENTVFVYVDFNTGLDSYLTTVPGPVLRNNVGAFAAIGRAYEAIPLAVFGEVNDYYGPFYPEIEALIDAGAPNFRRTTPSGYTPEFAEWLKATGRRNIVIGGISIDNCTLHTSLDLLEGGYNVFVVTDVSPTNSEMAQDVATRRLERAGAVPISWITLATDLIGDWASPEGQTLIPIMSQYLAGSTVGEPIDTTADGRGL